jgi:hypothetical protein
LQQRFLGRYKSILFGTWLAALQLLTALTASAWTLQPETLHYTIDASIFKDAAQVTVSLRQVDHEKFEGEVSVATNGLIAFCTAHRQDRYHTTMRSVQGRLQPLIYFEESKWGGKQRYLEYRFDYDRQRLELWRRGKDGILAQKWEKELTATIYDPISAFYNFRLGVLGKVKGGKTMTVAGIPYPHPETMTIRLGPQEPGNRQATLTVRAQPQENAIAPVHIRFDDRLVPLSAWTKTSEFGEVSGRLTGRE